MTSTPNQVQQARAAVDQVAQQLRTDGEYAKRFRSDPVGVLLDAGMPAGGVIEALREEGASDADVAGYAARLEATMPSLTPNLRPVDECSLTCLFTGGCHLTL